MSLSRKLARLTHAGPGSKPRETASPDVEPVLAEDDARWSAFKSALGKKAVREEARRPVFARARPIPGEIVETTEGPLHRIVQRFPVTHRHGHTAVSPARAVQGALLAQIGLDTTLGDVDASRLVFLDTETTGLAGGTGTIPFLIGVAYFEDETLVVEQWLLRRYGEESPMLTALAARLAGASGIVTYNGKSFDWPLLRTRFVLHRLPSPKVHAHVDLLHCAKRLVRHRVASARLVEVERQVLGHVREDDIDGAEIPEVFMALARHGDHPDIDRVIAHNAMDLVALPALLASLASRLDGTADTSDAHDHLACARVLSRAGDDAGVSRFASRAQEEGEGEPVAHALMLAARHARRADAADDEARLLGDALAASRDDVTRAYAHLALSKHFEHRAKDLGLALTHARETADAEGEDACLRRVARLEKRHARRAT